MPISTDREKKILEILQKQGSASVLELAEIFGVSNMTVHRDLNKLDGAGLIQKRYGGATLPAKSTGDERCGACGKGIQGRTAFILNLETGEKKRACCAHCGLMLREEHKKAQAFATDYLRGHIVSASQAAYLINSEVSVCCVPSVLTFGSRQDAEKFKKGFSGEVATLREALQHLRGMMRV